MSAKVRPGLTTVGMLEVRHSKTRVFKTNLKDSTKSQVCTLLRVSLTREGDLRFGKSILVS